MRRGDDDELSIPGGDPMFLGYVVQKHNLRNTARGMTKGWAVFGERIEPAIRSNVVAKLKPLGQVIQWKNSNDYNLGEIPNLHSLIPYSQEARKPIFDCTGRDGLAGAHINPSYAARNERPTLA